MKPIAPPPGGDGSGTLSADWLASWIAVTGARRVVAVQPGADGSALTVAARRRQANLRVVDGLDDLDTPGDRVGAEAPDGPAAGAVDPAPGPAAASAPSPPGAHLPPRRGGRRFDLLFLGAGVRASDLPRGVATLVADAGTLAGAPGLMVAPLPLGHGAGAARPALAMADAGPDAAVLAALDAVRAASERERPLAPIAPAVGMLLYVLARTRRARRVLDLGTSGGAAALWLGSAVARSGGHVTAIERDAQRALMARKGLRRAGLADRVSVEIGEVARLAPRLAGSYDLVFMDEDPEDRADDLTALLPRCAAGAVVISHGAGADPGRLAGVNALLRSLPRVTATLGVAVGDGLTLAVV